MRSFDPNATMPIDATQTVVYTRQAITRAQLPERQREEGEPPAWVLFLGSVGGVLLVGAIWVGVVFTLLN